MSSLLVESICGSTSTVKPGRMGSMACHKASAGQRKGLMAVMRAEENGMEKKESGAGRAPVTARAGGGAFFAILNSCAREGVRTRSNGL